MIEGSCRMRSLLGLASAALVIALATQLASAQTPTPTTVPPTGTPSPTASLSPSSPPSPTSTIRIRFLRNGEPTTFSPPGTMFADHAICDLGFTNPPDSMSEFVIGWPLPPLPNQPFECGGANPVYLYFQFPSRWGLLVANFEWSGSDVNFVGEAPPCDEIVGESSCRFEGTMFTGVEGCRFLSAESGKAVGPFRAQAGAPFADLSNFTDGDHVRVLGYWLGSGTIPTYCSHPYPANFFVIEDIQPVPGELPDTGGRP